MLAGSYVNGKKAVVCFYKLLGLAVNRDVPPLVIDY